MNLSARAGYLVLAAVAAFVSCRDFRESRGGTTEGPSGAGNGGVVGSGGVAGIADAEGLAGEAPVSGNPSTSSGGGDGGRRSEGDLQAGSSGQAGDAGNVIDNNEPEPVLVPSCQYLYNFVPTSASVLAFARTNDLAESLFSWDPVSSTALVRWSGSQFPKTGWSAWVCFDLLPGVRRLAAANLPNHYGLAFAVAKEQVFVRHEAAPNWSPWLPLGLPSRHSVVDDVAASSGRLPRVYIVDRGQVFYRSKVATDAYADWGIWSAISPNDAVLLATDQDALPFPVVVTLSSSGEIAVASQPDESAAFEEWITSPGLDEEVIDLDVVAGDEVDVFALDAAGHAWTTRIGADGWTSLVEPDTKVFIQAIATSPEGDVYGVDAGANVYKVEERGWVLVTTKFGG